MRRRSATEKRSSSMTPEVTVPAMSAPTVTFGPMRLGNSREGNFRMRVWVDGYSWLT